MGKSLTPTVRLAMSLQAQPGVYALLLGSGVSAGAGVPTGWQVMVDLARKVLVASGDDSGDPEQWLQSHFDGAPNYSELLEQLGSEKATRQGLLERYFESSDDGESLKPGKSHEAIARLVSSGHVRVIVTTNFDTLIEDALTAIGLKPQVISQPSDVLSMTPLAHTRITVIKLHGDYKQIDTLNTSEELSVYPEEWQTLLRQVFGDYGLVIAGWSAEWDVALVDALKSHSKRKYPLFWDSRSSNSDKAQQLVTNLEGQIIQSEDADSMFNELLESVDALERIAEPPLSTDIAIARLKKYLPDPARRIDLHDIVMGYVDEIIDQPCADIAISGDGTGLLETYEYYAAPSLPLVKLVNEGVWHDHEGAHDQLWMDVLKRLIDYGTANYYSSDPAFSRASLVPALLLLGSVGTLSVARGREELFVKLGSRVEGRDPGSQDVSFPAAQLLHVYRVFENVNLPNMRNDLVNMICHASVLLRNDLRPLTKQFIPNERDYIQAFYGYEYRIGLVQLFYTDDGLMYKPAPGVFVNQHEWSREDSGMPLAEIAYLKQIAQASDTDWIDLFGTEDIWRHAIKRYRETLTEYRDRRNC